MLSNHICQGPPTAICPRVYLPGNETRERPVLDGPVSRFASAYVCLYSLTICLWVYMCVNACFSGQDPCDLGVLRFFLFDLFVVALSWFSLRHLFTVPFLDTRNYLCAFNS